MCITAPPLKTLKTSPVEVDLCYVGIDRGNQCKSVPEITNDCTSRIRPKLVLNKNCATTGLYKNKTINSLTNDGDHKEPTTTFL